MTTKMPRKGLGVRAAEKCTRGFYTVLWLPAVGPESDRDRESGKSQHRGKLKTSSSERHTRNQNDTGKIGMAPAQG